MHAVLFIGLSCCSFIPPLAEQDAGRDLLIVTNQPLLGRNKHKANPLLFSRKNKKSRLWEAGGQERADLPGCRSLEWAGGGL